VPDVLREKVVGKSARAIQKKYGKPDGMENEGKTCVYVAWNLEITFENGKATDVKYIR
jgi:hypothetical protein